MDLPRQAIRFVPEQLRARNNAIEEYKALAIRPNIVV
jgi:hypothetical protein